MTEDPATLLVIEGTDQGARFELTGEMFIGRGTQNKIRILDTEASRVHARILNDQQGWLLEDLDSSNGTIVNGELIKSRYLESGDQIQLGGSILVFAESKTLESSLLNVDLIGGSSFDDHSQIIQTYSPKKFAAETSTNRNSLSAGQLQPDDVLRILGNIAEQAVRPSMTMAELLERVLRMILQLVQADRGCILLIDAETGKIVPHASISSAETVPAAPNARMPVSKTIVDYVLKSGQAVRTTDPLHDTRFDPGNSILQAGVKEAICVPLQGRLKLLGAIYLDLTDSNRILGATKKTTQHLTDEQLRLMTAVGKQCALAIENFQYQSSLVDAERLAAIGQTIAGLSHHIKNILQGVRGGSYLIDLGLKQDEKDLILKGWTLVEKNQDKIYHLVMDMLTYSKERTPSIETSSLNDIVKDVFELMEPHAQECGVHLEFSPGEDVPESSFDPEAIHRAVLNILSNAIDATEQGERDGWVAIITKFDSRLQQLMVEVRDNGPGIPEELKTKIFKVFESTKGSRGTGIGLAVSLKILQEHGGGIQVESEPDSGATFVLHWPYSNEANQGSPSGTLVENKPG